MDEFERIIFWVWKIGEGEKTLVELSKNVKKAKEAVELLEKYSLIRTRKKGRIHLVSLSEKGINLYRRLRELRELVGIVVPREEESEETTHESPPVEDAGTPSFIADNPWLQVIARRGRERLGL
ncbi:MAG: hypothetical protein ABWK01_04665 [Infirmifilum sp.]